MNAEDLEKYWGLIRSSTNRIARNPAIKGDIVATEEVSNAQSDKQKSRNFAPLDQRNFYNVMKYRSGPKSVRPKSVT